MDYSFFFKKELVSLVQSKPRTPPHYTSIPTEISPISHIILSTVSPESKHIMLDLLHEDTRQITQAESEDVDYQEKMTNQGLGFYMENFVSWYGVCPVCKQTTLRKYWHSNVPVVDLVCINKNYHLNTRTCFLFQLKISMTTNYFSFQRQTISVGSKVYGKFPHSTSGIDNWSRKQITPGYICLKMNQTGPDTYAIDKRLSFILVPDYHKTSNQRYYEYLNTTDQYGKDVITWNPSMFDFLSVDSILNVLEVSYEYFEEVPTQIPIIISRIL